MERRETREKWELRDLLELSPLGTEENQAEMVLTVSPDLWEPRESKERLVPPETKECLVFLEHPVLREHVEKKGLRDLREIPVPKEILESTASLALMVFPELMVLRDPRENRVMLESRELVFLELMVLMEPLETKETREKWVCQEPLV